MRPSTPRERSLDARRRARVASSRVMDLSCHFPSRRSRAQRYGPGPRAGVRGRARLRGSLGVCHRDVPSGHAAATARLPARVPPRARRCLERRSAAPSPSLAIRSCSRFQQSRSRIGEQAITPRPARRHHHAPPLAARARVAIFPAPIVRVLSPTRTRPPSTTRSLGPMHRSIPATQRHMLTNLVFPLTQMSLRGLYWWEFKGCWVHRGYPTTHRTYPL